MATDLIEGYLAYLRSISASDDTIKARRRTLTVLDRELPYGLEEVAPEDLIAWLWRDGLSAGSRDTYYGCMAGFYRWAVSVDHFDFDPTAEIPRPKVPRRLPRPVSDEQLVEVITRAGEPYRLWALLAAYAGLRCVEISRLHREDITERTITVRRGKGDKPRVVPTHPDIWSEVSELPAGPITDLDAHQVSIYFVLHVTRVLKIKGVSLHPMRHWFGTMVQRLHRDLRVTQELLGHANPATTAGYALVSADDSRAAVSLLPSVGELCAGSSATASA